MDEMIKSAQQGNHQAFTQLMQMQMQNMYKAARSLLQNDEDVADAISETILVCWEKLSQLKNEKYFRTWMTRILINKCNDILRKKVNLFYTGEVPEVPTEDLGMQNVEWREALNVLDKRYRLVLMLYYVEGFSTNEISQILEMPVSTVRTRLARGRKQLVNDYDPKWRETV